MKMFKISSLMSLVVVMCSVVDSKALLEGVTHAVSDTVSGVGQAVSGVGHAVADTGDVVLSGGRTHHVRTRRPYGGLRAHRYGNLRAHRYGGLRAGKTHGIHATSPRSTGSRSRLRQTHTRSSGRLGSTARAAHRGK